MSCGVVWSVSGSFRNILPRYSFQIFAFEQPGAVGQGVEMFDFFSLGGQTQRLWGDGQKHGSFCQVKPRLVALR